MSPARVVAVLFFVSLSSGFNLDPRFSVVKKGPKNYDSNQTTYFGYSIAQFQSVDSRNNTLDDLFLIGAPKADPAAIPGHKNTGALYRCNARSTMENDCVQIIGEPFSTPPSEYEEIEDQWLGVTLASQGRGGKILICAHRFQSRNKGLGVCYTMSQGVILGDPNFEGDYTPWQPCQGRDTQQMHQTYGLCQAGTSGTLTKNYGLVLGAPGSFNWIGEVMVSNISDELGVRRQFISSPVQGENPRPPVSRYSYLGYAVTSGVFDSTRKVYYVSGAPRADDRGQVAFFTMDQQNSMLVYAENQILSGPQDFSAFGYALIALDLNQDGYDDLVVGAPFYHKKKEKFGGAIYVYPGGKAINKLTKPTEILSRSMSDAECTLLQCEHARFGFSLATIGDVNRDGFPDFVVGAPYEGKGAIYIYHGSPSGVNPEYAQRIYAEDIPTQNLGGFGHSVSGGLDMDNNGYADLMVGSFESEHAVLIRSRPVINLISRVEVTPQEVNLTTEPFCPFDRTKHHCIQFKVCLRFTAEPRDRFKETPTVRYTIEAERERSILRVEMKTNSDNRREVSGQIILPPQAGKDDPAPEPKCETELAYLKESIQDKLNPIIFVVSYSLEQKDYIHPAPGQPLVDINAYPILATHGGDTNATSTTITRTVDFAKECGSDNRCESNLQFNLVPSLNQNSLGQHVLSMGEDESFNITVHVTNLGEPAYFTQVYINTTGLLEYQTTTTIFATNPDTKVKCEPTMNKTMIECSEIGNPLPSNHEVRFNITVGTRLVKTSTDGIVIRGLVNTTSFDRTPESNNKSFSFGVIIRANIMVTGQASPDTPIIYGGSGVGESAVTVEDDIGPPVTHTYVVTNMGPGTVAGSTLYIQWPYEVENGKSQGKHLLYLMQAPVVTQTPPGSYCEIDEKYINPAQIDVNPAYEISPKSAESLGPSPILKPRTKRRSKRQAISDSRTKRDSGKTTILGCQQKTAKCHEIRCYITTLAEDEYIVVHIRSRLWNSTLAQDFMGASEVKIRSRAHIEVDPSLNILQPEQNDDYDYAVTQAIPDVTDAPYKSVEWWIILVAVLAGIIFLVIIIIIFWKLGFFKRKKPEDMVTYEATLQKKKNMEEQEAMLS